MTLIIVMRTGIVKVVNSPGLHTKPTAIVAEDRRWRANFCLSRAPVGSGMIAGKTISTAERGCDGASWAPVSCIAHNILRQYRTATALFDQAANLSRMLAYDDD